MNNHGEHSDKDERHMDICEECIKIGECKFSFSGKRIWKKKCESCGAWWEVKQIKTLKYHWDPCRQKYFNCDFLSRLGRFRPIQCEQKKCTEHARHKIKTNKKKKYMYKCDKHAGVCIII